MKDYTVTAKRWERGWELYVEDIGVTQSRSLALAEQQAKDYLCSYLDLNENDFTVTIVPTLDAEIQAEVSEARAIVGELEIRQQETAAKSRQIAKKLDNAGLTGNDIARVLGVSPQRISQLLQA